MALYNVYRRQMVPSGVDKIVGRVESVGYPKSTLIEYAEKETESRKDVDHISLGEKRVSLIGQPAGTGNKFSPTSIMVRFDAELTKV